MSKELERALLQIGNIDVNDMEWQGQDNWVKLKDTQRFKIILQELEDKQSKLDKINKYNRTEINCGIVYDKIKEIIHGGK
jgi:GH25 family lysozyme M1 (1,4-beta-N-acetylmuramidase)